MPRRQLLVTALALASSLSALASPSLASPYRATFQSYRYARPIDYRRELDFPWHPSRRPGLTGGCDACAARSPSWRLSPEETSAPPAPRFDGEEVPFR